MSPFFESCLCNWITHTFIMVLKHIFLGIAHRLKQNTLYPCIKKPLDQWNPEV